MIKGFKSKETSPCDIVLRTSCFLLAEDTVHFYLLMFAIFACCSEDDHIVENESAGPSKRKRRLVLDADMETKIRDLYERYVLFYVSSSY